MIEPTDPNQNQNSRNMESEELKITSTPTPEPAPTPAEPQEIPIAEATPITPEPTEHYDVQAPTEEPTPEIPNEQMPPATPESTSPMPEPNVQVSTVGMEEPKESKLKKLITPAVAIIAVLVLGYIAYAVFFKSTPAPTTDTPPTIDQQSVIDTFNQQESIAPDTSSPSDTLQIEENSNIDTDTAPPTLNIEDNTGEDTSKISR